MVTIGMTESNMKKDEQQDCQWDVIGRSRRHLRHTYYMCKCKECGFTREIRSEYIKTIRCEACTKRWVSHCNTIDDFWKFVEKTETCWLWTQARSKSFGYGRFSLNGKRWRAHVLSYVIHFGPIPDGKFVLHKCDVTNCVNPDHLFLGDPADNVKDMHEKKRGRGMFKRGQFAGSLHPKARLKESDVRMIKRLIKEGKDIQNVRRALGASNQMISAIRTGKTWTHVHCE